MRPHSSGLARRLTSRPRKAKYISGAGIYTNQPIARIYLCKNSYVTFSIIDVDVKLVYWTIYDILLGLLTLPIH
ncbi:hypothetical protein J2S14_002642 [Lederbergia wuyishanensis]|uniref:Uncharacterized protein n=1 Tax=Lederbergia wuyishanensis TaxID=1347903 RepID=A0ABU0D5W6_9BACI|nr:hypothetical protein [Lederbergia wuyishanensis]